MPRYEFVLSEDIYHVIIDTLAVYVMNCPPDEAEPIYKALQMLQVQAYHQDYIRWYMGYEGYTITPPTWVYNEIKKENAHNVTYQEIT